MLLIKRLFCLKAILFSFLFIFSTSSFSDTKTIPLENSREYFKRSVLVISHEKIFGDTKLGKSIFKKFKDEEEVLSIEAEKIEQIFINEEKELTLIRPNLVSDEFLKLALCGLSSLLIFQTFIHVGVNTSLLPTTGMTLPFLSYGGSSLIGSAILAGLVLNFTKNKTYLYD